MNTDSNKIEIIAFNEALKDYIKTLNFEWLEKYFRVETDDFMALSNPKEYIIDKGGFIYYVKLNNEIVATVSLLKKSETIYEIGKMAVTSKAQGNKIGNLLVEHCLEIARQKQFKKLILYSNTKLETAIYLYRKHGFIETTLEDGLYERANIKMEKQL